MRRPNLRVYSIHLPPPYSGKDQEPDALREGFSVPAFGLTVIWVLAHRLWMRAGLLAVIIAVLAVSVYVLGMGDIGQVIVSLAFMIWVGMEGNDWRRHALARRGWRDGRRGLDCNCGDDCAAGDDGCGQYVGRAHVHGDDGAGKWHVAFGCDRFGGEQYVHAGGH